MLEKQNKTNVFEMILDTQSSRSASAEAAPSKIEVPSDWHTDHVEGQLAIDVLQTSNDIVVISTMAGALTERIEVFVHNDLLTIKGGRDFPLKDKEKLEFFHQECFWGKFSRTIVLPADVMGDLARAEYKNGVLVVFIPKQKKGGKVPITIIEE